MNKNENPVHATVKIGEPKILSPQGPAPAVVERQDPTHTRENFMRDLDKVTQPRGSSR